ncbi:hypothetical protein [Haladaptatus sp. DJG-WS-42]|uniref:hypothetical protein n=1 Tax=Haladaptatus sp. DJG-WS-42 TaxID=3120516 RepID=UPI0030CF6AC8
MSHTAWLPMAEVKPSQLYLSSEKLSAVMGWFDFDEPTFGPLPVFEYEGDTYLADGHTRAFVAHLAGCMKLPVTYDPEIRTSDDFPVYVECINWCAEEGVETVPDLSGRVLSPEAYDVEWIDRCHRLATQLD